MNQHVARDSVPVDTHNLTLAQHRVSSSSVVKHPATSRRVMVSNPIWDSDFSESACVLEFTLYYVDISVSFFYL